MQTDGQPPTGLGHRRLAIIDLSDAGLQPMTIDPRRRWVECSAGSRLTFNGEIYNYRELARGAHRGRASVQKPPNRLGGVAAPLRARCASRCSDGFERGSSRSRFTMRAPVGPAGRSGRAAVLFIARDQLGVKSRCTMAPNPARLPVSRLRDQGVCCVMADCRARSMPRRCTTCSLTSGHRQPADHVSGGKEARSRVSALLVHLPAAGQRHWS